MKKKIPTYPINAKGVESHDDQSFFVKHHIVIETPSIGSNSIVCFDYVDTDHTEVESFEDILNAGHLYDAFTASGGSMLGTVVSACYWVYQVEVTQNGLKAHYMKGNASPQTAILSITSITDYITNL